MSLTSLAMIAFPDMMTFVETQIETFAPAFRRPGSVPSPAVILLPRSPARRGLPRGSAGSGQGGGWAGCTPQL